MYKDTEFLYASTRIRALEDKISTRELNEKLIGAQSFDEAASLYLDAVGSRFRTEGDSIEYENILDCELEELYALVRELSPDDSLVNIFKYPYDCQNIKSAVKCEMLGEDCRKMLFSFGTVDEDTLCECLRTRDFSPFPLPMANAALQALEAVSRADDPQLIDILLDKACLETCFEESRNTCSFLRELMRTKIDLYNFSVLIRGCRMKKSFAYLRTLFITCASFDADFFEKCYDISGTEKFQSRLQSTAYSELAEKLQGGLSVTQIQKLFDEYYLSRIKAAKLVSFGSEILCAYIVMRENEIKNSRIILSAKKASLPETSIRQRIRVCD